MASFQLPPNTPARRVTPSNRLDGWALPRSAPYMNPPMARAVVKLRLVIVVMVHLFVDRLDPLRSYWGTISNPTSLWIIQSDTTDITAISVDTARMVGLKSN